MDSATWCGVKTNKAHARAGCLSVCLSVSNSSEDILWRNDDSRGVGVAKLEYVYIKKNVCARASYATSTGANL